MPANGKPAARQGDPTACPLPGHGNNPISGGSSDVLIDGLPAARAGDPSACGSTLTGNLVSNVLVNGRPLATQGSLGSHGNVVIGGSGTVIVGNGFTPAPFEAPAPLPSWPSMPAPPAVPRPAGRAEPELGRDWREEPGDPALAELEEEGEEEELEETVEQGIVLRIGVFFDGTGNNLANAALTERCRRDDRELMDERSLAETVTHCTAHGYRDSNDDGRFDRLPDNSYGNAKSNVALLYQLYRDESDQVLPGDTQAAHLAVYLEGVGTTSGGIDSRFSQGTGMGDTGVLARVAESPTKIAEQLRALLRINPELQIGAVEFDVFGFSRGAASARHFANEVLKGAAGALGGLLVPEAPGFVAGFAWSAVRINFIGLFDTVAAIADLTRLDASPADDYNPGVNLYLPPGSARKVLQLTARDERRWNFSLNSVRAGPGDDAGHEEIRLPGVHSDLGGGYPPLVEERLLLSRTRTSVVPRGHAPERTVAWRDTEREGLAWLQRGLPGDGELRVDCWTTPLPRERRIDQGGEERVHAALAIRRRVRGELSLVYLRVMRELAAKHGAPLDPVDESDPYMLIPADLQVIAAKIMAYARGGADTLTAEDNTVLHARYIHLSAHWTPSAGLLVHKPAPHARLVFNNRPQEGYPQ
ncbi:PAAR motif protein [compost metagenome]